MLFGLNNAHVVFFRVVVVSFKDFISQLIEVYLDYWNIFILLKDHIETLRLMLDRCIQYHISLNLKKYILYTPFEILLGHVVCKKGLLVDTTNIVVIFNFPLLELII